MTPQRPVYLIVLVADLPFVSASLAPFLASHPRVGQVFTLLPGKNLLGREPAPNLTIALPSCGVSRRHAQIELDPYGTWEITDLQSRNGTEVNGQHLQPGSPFLLCEGDRIGIVNYQFLFSERLLPPALATPFETSANVQDDEFLE